MPQKSPSLYLSLSNLSNLRPLSSTSAAAATDASAAPTDLLHSSHLSSNRSDLQVLSSTPERLVGGDIGGLKDVGDVGEGDISGREVDDVEVGGEERGRRLGRLGGGDIGGGGG